MSLSIMQLMIILLIILVLFGAGRLPQVMEDLGKGLKSFKDALHNNDSEKKNNKN